MKRKITALGVPLVATAAVALGGAGASPAASSCSHNLFEITKRHNVSCDTAKKVFKDYYAHGNYCDSHPTSNGTKCVVKNHKKWKCPRPWNDQTGKCVKDSNTSFRYRSSY